MEKKTMHIVSHSHWDREWYMSFEQHRMRLVELFDALIDTMEKHPDYKYYHMDGQYIVIEDYLEIRPQMRDRLQKLIAEDRIQIGPWYVLQDEYLTSGESNVRNMLYGLKLCREFGAKPVECGYFPDAFGNISQAPQILKGFDIDYAAFGRGIRDIMENNTVDENTEVNPSEIIWRSPDGSEVIGVMFVRWYHNSMELPTTPKALKKKLDKTIGGLAPATATPYMLGLNGCDHQPVQTDVHEAIALANEIYDDVNFVHSNFKDFCAAITPYKDKFPVFEGEIAGQETKGAVPLIDTASTHVPIKQRNHKGQNALDRIAEPLSVIAMHAGDDYRSDQLLYAWRVLMQNHPHDSICTCSCDDVAREMVTRFEKSLQVATFVADEAREATANAIDTWQLSDHNIVVYHTSPFVTTDTVTTYVDFPKDSKVADIHVVDMNGNVIPSVAEDMGVQFTYRLPKDKFRKVTYAKRFKVTMLVKGEGIGYATYMVKEGKAPVKTAVKATKKGAQNEFISFEIQPNGSITVTDLTTGRVYENNNVYEDLADIGESYNFRPVKNDVAITTLNDKAKIWKESQTDYSVTFGIQNTMNIPARAVDGKRVTDTLKHTITTYVTLTAGINRLDVKTHFENAAEDHRFRALFMPNLVCDTALAEGQFDVVDRAIVPHKNWKNPCYCQRMQAFFGLQDKNDGAGLLIATRGLNEYEILRDGQNTMALTLLRCVGFMGDWGIFPTPDAQCKGAHTLEYAIIPFNEASRASAYHSAFSFNGAALSALSTGKHKGTQPAEKTLVKASGDFMSFAAFKKAEDGNAAVLRFYNSDREETALNLTFPIGISNVTATNLEEKDVTALPAENQTLTIPGKKIVTYKIEF